MTQSNTQQDISLLNINLSNARSENESYEDYRARLKRNKDILKTYFTFGREAFREMFPNGVADAITQAQAQMAKDGQDGKIVGIEYGKQQ